MFAFPLLHQLFRLAGLGVLLFLSDQRLIVDAAAVPDVAADAVAAYAGAADAVAVDAAPQWLFNIPPIFRCGEGQTENCVRICAAGETSADGCL